MKKHIWYIKNSSISLFGISLNEHFGAAYQHELGFFHSTLLSDISIYDKGYCNNCDNPIIN